MVALLVQDMVVVEMVRVVVVIIGLFRCDYASLWVVPAHWSVGPSVHPSVHPFRVIFE